MIEKIISFTTAKLANSKKVNICTDYKYYIFLEDYYFDYRGGDVLLYKKGEEMLSSTKGDDYHKKADCYYAPTQDMLKTELRQCYNTHVDVGWEQVNDESKWYYFVSTIGVDTPSEHDENLFFDTYEEALESGLVHALNLIK